MKRKLRLFGIVVLAAVLISLCFFGVRVRLVPRWVLSRALESALTELETRFEHSPAHLVGQAMDPQGRQEGKLQLETSLNNLLVVRYDMSFRTQLAPCRISAEGTVLADGKALDLELYLDGDFAAVSSKGLVEGNYYGITYDRFSQDIRSRELLAVLIGDKTISQWEESIARLDTALDVNLSLPEISLKDIPSILYGIQAFKPQVDAGELLIAGKYEQLYTVSFRATGAEIASVALDYVDKLSPEIHTLIGKLGNDPETVVNAVFYLHNGKLLKIDGSLETSEQALTASMELGKVPAVDLLTLDVHQQTVEGAKRFSIALDTESDEDSYQETISLAITEKGVRQIWGMDYDWDLSSGEMTLKIQKNDQKADLRLHLAGEGEELTITCQNISPLISLFKKKPMESPAICTLRFSPGGEVLVPAYRNLDQWSAEDILTLLTGLGGLLGIPLP